MPITNRNKKGGYITASFFDTGYIALNSTNSAVAANTAGETVQSMLITSIEVNVPAGANNVYFGVRRGANTVFVGAGDTCHDFSDSRAIDNYGGCPQANVVVQKYGTGPGFLLIKLHKTSAVSGGSQY